MTRRQSAPQQERRVTSDPHLNAELARLWADKPTPLEVPEHGTPQPRTALTDKLDAWLKEITGGAYGTSKVVTHEKQPTAKIWRYLELDDTGPDRCPD